MNEMKRCRYDIIIIIHFSVCVAAVISDVVINDYCYRRRGIRKNECGVWRLLQYRSWLS